MPTILHTIVVESGSGFIGSAASVDAFMKAAASGLRLALTPTSVTQKERGDSNVLEFLFSYVTAAAAENQALKDIGLIVGALKVLADNQDPAAFQARIDDARGVFASDPANTLAELLAELVP
jgi:hypothetical protein